MVVASQSSRGRRAGEKEEAARKTTMDGGVGESRKTSTRGGANPSAVSMYGENGNGGQRREKREEKAAKAEK